MSSREEIKIRIAFHVDAVQKLRAAYISLVDSGVQSYSIGSRSLTRWDIKTIMDEIKEHESAIDELEGMLCGGKRRKALGVIPRDW